jgi:hypothetical protein
LSGLDESDLKALLADPRLPIVDRAYRNPGFRHVLVWRAVAMAEAKHGGRAGLEGELDAAVEAVGGERLETVDPWRWIPDLLRRLRGAPLPPRDDVYAIPEEFFEASQRAPGG